jgi:hypothetical protein
MRNFWDNQDRLQKALLIAAAVLIAYGLLVAAFMLAMLYG